MKNISPKSALISLSDKTNLDLLVSFLLERNVEIISTGGTYKAIKKITDNVIEVSEYTGHEDGSMLSSSADNLIIFVDQNLTSSQTEIKITFATDFSSKAGISGSGELIKLHFTASATSATGVYIIIEDLSNLRNFENDRLNWSNPWRLNGKIIIQ